MNWSTIFLCVCVYIYIYIYIYIIMIIKKWIEIYGSELHVLDPQMCWLLAHMRIENVNSVFYPDDEDYYYHYHYYSFESLSNNNSPGLLSVFLLILIILLFGWSPLVLLFSSPPVPLPFLWWHHYYYYPILCMKNIDIVLHFCVLSSVKILLIKNSLRVKFQSVIYVCSYWIF